MSLERGKVYRFRCPTNTREGIGMPLLESPSPQKRWDCDRSGPIPHILTRVQDRSLVIWLERDDENDEHRVIFMDLVGWLIGMFEEVDERDEC